MKKNGFTMVELIIVVAIIAVLASIIMPKMSGARDKGKLSACKGNLKALAVAIEMYANDNGGSYGGTWRVVNASHFLVTSGYSKVVQCPLGNNYWTCAPYAGYNPAVPYMIWCMSDTSEYGTPHAGLSPSFPRYIPNRGLFDR